MKMWRLSEVDPVRINESDFEICIIEMADITKVQYSTSILLLIREEGEKLIL